MIAHVLTARGGAFAPPSAQAAQTKATRRVPDFARSNRRAPLSPGFPHAVSRRAATAARVLSSGKDFELCDPAPLPGPSSPLFTMDISTPTVLTSDLASVMEPPMCRLAPKKTHIICTLGPSSRSVEDLENLLQAGMSVARFNFSHGTHEYHLETLENLRLASANTGRVCAVLLDTKGPEIRSGALVDGEPVRLSRGSRIELTTDYAHVGTNAKIAISYEHLARDVKQGDTILMSDGNVMLEVLETDPTNGTVACECLNDATLGERKNCNLPGVKVDLPTMTEKDLHDIVDFGVANDVDFIAASFVRKARDVATIRETLRDAGGDAIKIISKVENYEGLCNYDAILDASDGIMVARGDLGMEIPLERIFWVQKMMIRKANLLGKPVITATQMLDSMIAAPRPTRAEATDVANAVLDGADAVMLSGETANGSFPEGAVQIMARTCMEAEAMLIAKDTSGYDSIFQQMKDAKKKGFLSHVESAASSAVKTACDINSKAIIVLSETGETARLIAKYHPNAKIVAVCGDAAVARQIEGYMCNALAIVAKVPRGGGRHVREAFIVGKEKGLYADGDAVLAVHTMRSPDGVKEWTSRIIHVTSSEELYQESGSNPVAKRARND